MPRTLYRAILRACRSLDADASGYYRDWGRSLIVAESDASPGEVPALLTRGYESIAWVQAKRSGGGAGKLPTVQPLKSAASSSWSPDDSS